MNRDRDCWKCSVRMTEQTDGCMTCPRCAGVSAPGYCPEHVPAMLQARAHRLAAALRGRRP